MNKVRRNAIENILTKLADIQSDIESVCEDEQEAYDAMPENLQYSERGDSMQEAIDNLEYAVSSLEEVIDYLTEAQSV